MEKKLCKFPLTGDMVEYGDERDLIRSIPVAATQMLRLVRDEILPHDREAGVTVYAFVDLIRVQLTQKEFEYASCNLSCYYDLENEDFLRLFLHHLPNFPDVFENPHPMVVQHFMSLPPSSYTAYDLNKLRIALSANPSEELFEFLLANQPDLIDWKYVVTYNTNRRIFDRAVEYHRTSPLPLPRDTPNRRLCFLHRSTSPETVEFALSLVGGIDEVMKFKKNSTNSMCSHFLRNNSDYANAKKLEWLRDKIEKNVEIDKRILEQLAACSNDAEILYLVLAKMDPPGDIWHNPHDLVVDYLIQYMKTHSSAEISPQDRYKIAWHKHPRVIQFLLNDDGGKEWIFFPHFFSNSNVDATAYSLEWIGTHYEELAQGVGEMSLETVSEYASINKNTKMLLTLYTQYPLLIERKDCEWLYTVGRNSEIGIDLTNVGECQRM